MMETLFAPLSSLDFQLLEKKSHPIRKWLLGVPEYSGNHWFLLVVENGDVSRFLTRFLTSASVTSQWPNDPTGLFAISMPAANRGQRIVKGSSHHHFVGPSSKTFLFEPRKTNYSIPVKSGS